MVILAKGFPASDGPKAAGCLPSRNLAWYCKGLDLWKYIAYIQALGGGRCAVFGVGAASQRLRIHIDAKLPAWLRHA